VPTVLGRGSDCCTILQHPFTKGGSHILWGPPLVNGCCMIVVHLVYNNHYSLGSDLYTHTILILYNNDTTLRHNRVGSMCGLHSIVPWCCVV